MPEPLPLPPIADQPISAVLLAHEDEAHVEAVVDEWAQRLESLNRDYEILVVDDGSTDRTLERAEAVAAQRPRIRVLRHPKPGGAGDALRLALAEATRPLLLTTTCDRQYDPADLPALLAEMDKLHLVSGLRRWLPMPAGLRLLGAVYRLLVRILFGFAPDPILSWHGWREQAFRLLNRAAFAVRLRDVSCVFRLYRREIFEHIPIQSHGFFVHAEILAKANFLGCYMSEVPVSYRERANAPCGPWRRDFSRVFSHPRFEATPRENVPDWSEAGGQSTLPA